jgi:hypothetical protein
MLILMLVVQVLMMAAMPDADLCQVVQGQPSAWAMDGNDEKIIQCLKAIRSRDLSFIFFFVWHHSVTISGCAGSFFDESPCV